MTFALHVVLSLAALSGIGLVASLLMLAHHVRVLQRALAIEHARAHRMLAEIVRLRRVIERAGDEPGTEPETPSPRPTWPTCH